MIHVKSEENNGNRGAKARKSRSVCKKTRASKIGEHDTSGGSVERDTGATSRVSVESNTREGIGDIQEKGMRCL